MTTVNKAPAIKTTETLRPETIVGKPSTLGQWLEYLQPRITAHCHGKTTYGLVASTAMAAVEHDMKLRECTLLSFLRAIIESTSMGLIPCTPMGHAYLVPYKKEVKLIPGYQGLADLAYRSGEIATIEGGNVYPDDKFNYRLGINPVFELEQDLGSENRTPDKILSTYCMVRMKYAPQYPIIRVMSRAEVDLIRARSAGYNYAKKMGKKDNPWMTDEAKMRIKTVFKDAQKLLPKSPERQPELAHAMRLDTQYDLGQQQTFMTPELIIGEQEIPDAANEKAND